MKSAESSCGSHSSPFSCAREESGPDGRIDLVLCEQFWEQKTKRVRGLLCTILLGDFSALDYTLIIFVMRK